MDLNSVMLLGRVTREPDVRNLGNSKVITFRLAVNSPYKKGDSWADETAYIDCEAWGGRAEYLSRSLGKGTEVFVRGRLVTDEWVTKDTKERRSKTKVRVLETKVGSGRKKGETVKAEKTSDSGQLDIEIPF